MIKKQSSCLAQDVINVSMYTQVALLVKPCRLKVDDDDLASIFLRQ